MSTVTVWRVIPNLYKDSVSLMQLGATLRAREGLEEASCVMATPANLAQLIDADLAVDAQAAPSDLLVVVRGEAAACAAALDAAEAALRAPAAAAAPGRGFEPPQTSLALAVEREPDADLALISVPGDYAAAEALKAIRLGLHVMLFSDNVALADERAIKLEARERGLLVMGPDCGTAIVNGVALGFANVVRRGDIGIVAASGTGLQEVTCRIHHRGGGVSQALGTGGRDLKEEIGGISMLQGLAMLAADASTRVIVLVSKPPAPAVAARVEAAAAAAGKPVVVHFIGAPAREWPAGLHGARSLREAADLAVALARGERPSEAEDLPDHAAAAFVARHRARFASPPARVLGLFTGGTFSYEAQLAFVGRGLACYSNAPVDAALPHSGGDCDGHLLLDLGDDDYTRGRPHPMIDPSLRDAWVRRAGQDATVAAILFDVVLGHGAHPDPAAGLATALADAAASAAAQGRTLALIGHVCGTEDDPQGRAMQIDRLREAGAWIADSNIAAAHLAVELAAGGRGG